MRTVGAFLFTAVAVAPILVLLAAPRTGTTTGSGPAYTQDGQLKLPAHYREWVFLSSGLGMTYGPAAASDGAPPQFDNVFVNPEGYRGFLETGHWPDKTTFVLEIRSSASAGSINHGGHFQSGISAIEVHVKDSSAKNGLWNFYGFAVNDGQPEKTGKAFPRNSSCFACHTKSGAVEETFVQFYPELYRVAEQRGTVNAAFDRASLRPGK